MPGPVPPALFLGQKAGAAKHHYRVFHALFALVDIGLEHFQLDADTAGLAPKQKLGIGERKPVGIGLQCVAAVGVGMQFCPGICEAGFGQVLGVFHVLIVR